MIYLVGCEHSLQTFSSNSGYFPKAQRSFELYLLSAIRSNRVDLVAEELDLEFPKRKSRQSVALKLVSELKSVMKIDHRYCDPCPSRREQLGIGKGLPEIDDPFDPALKNLIRTKHEAHLHDIAHRWPIREKFWIESLGKDIHRNIIFICGALHLCTFGERLRASGVATKVIKRFFKHDTRSLKSAVFADEIRAYKHVHRLGFLPEIGCPCISSSDQNGQQSL
jgi:hypothetical protein